MNNEYEVVDQSVWKRAMHCQIFRNSIEPRYSVGFELDITDCLRILKQKQYSFTFSMVYFVSKCANQIPEFRYRFLDGDVVLYQTIDTAFTYLNPETELFHVIYVPMSASLEQYLASAEKTVQTQKEYFTGDLPNNIFQFSPLPWISFTHVSHTIPLNSDQATPIFDWGKYYERDGRTFLPFSVHVHHSFVDGLHIGRLSDQLQYELDRFGNF